MLKVDLTESGHSTVVQEYIISKKREDIAVVTSIDTKAKFEEPAYEYLFRSTIEGGVSEAATVTVFCGQERELLDGEIRHFEGDYLHKQCIAEKEIQLVNPFECIKELDLNIFDFPTEEIQTIGGKMERQSYSKSEVFTPRQGEVQSVEKLLGVLGGLGDLAIEGWFPEYINIYTDVLKETATDPTYGKYEIYLGHVVNLFVSYVRITSEEKISEYWLPLPDGQGTGYYFVGAPIEYVGPSIATVGIISDPSTGLLDEHIIVSYEAGRYQSFSQTSISNVVDFGTFLTSAFLCSFYPLVSNFFGINPDEIIITPEYSYAKAYTKELKIAQSYDIIKASADEDSFGKSGKINIKKMLEEVCRIFDLMLVFDTIDLVIRLEHVSYFRRKGINAVTRDLDYEMDDVISVNKERINMEIFRFAKETPTETFYESIIDYKNYKITDKLNIKTEQSELFITDYTGTINNKEYVRDDFKKLFFLLSTKDGAIVDANLGLAMQKIVSELKTTGRAWVRAVKDGHAIIFDSYSIGLESSVKFFGGITTFLKLLPFNSIRLKNGIWSIQEIQFSSAKMITLKIRK